MKKVKILIVEDEAIIAKDLEQRLQGMGYDVPSIATTGEDAFNKAKEFNPDLVLMDIILPGQMDGIEAANNIRLMADIPVIYLTAYADEEILDRAIKTEPFGYLIKPVEQRELQCIIKMAIYKHSMEKKLRESEERYRLLVENQDELVVKLDSDFRILFASPNFCRVFGKTKEDLINSEFMPLHQKKEHDRLKKTLKLFLEKPPHSTYYEELEETTEGRRWYGWSVKGVKDKNNMIKEIITVGRDITDQKLAKSAEKIP
jgi:PAS domain S-box-containing protein